MIPLKLKKCFAASVGLASIRRPTIKVLIKIHKHVGYLIFLGNIFQAKLNNKPDPTE
jgi:hypothetical protein